MSKFSDLQADILIALQDGYVFDGTELDDYNSMKALDAILDVLEDHGLITYFDETNEN